MQHFVNIYAENTLKHHIWVFLITKYVLMRNNSTSILRKYEIPTIAVLGMISILFMSDLQMYHYSTLKKNKNVLN